jgi:exosortase
MLFMVPLPLEVMADTSLKLKLLATRMAMALLDMTGILTINDGSTIYLENGSCLTVGNACSGLRSLIALIFLGVVFASLSDLSRPRKFLLFLASMPIAIIANVFRVYLLCLIAHFWGSQRIEGVIHDASGYLIFVIAFLLLYAVNRLLNWGKPKPQPESQPAASEGSGKEGHHA